MGLIDRYRWDAEKARKGARLPFGDPRDPIHFDVAYIRTAMAEAVSRMDPEDRIRYRHGKMPAGELLEFVLTACSEDLVTGWDNMQEIRRDDEGNPVRDERGRPDIVDVPYSPERVVSMLRDPELVEWHEWLLEVCQDRGNYRRDVLGAAAGNS